MKTSSFVPVVGAAFFFCAALASAADTDTKQKPVAAEAKLTPKNVTPDEVEKLLTVNPKPIVLDVRTPEEFAAGHIAGATNINAQEADFAKKVAELAPQNRPVIVHCAGGGRSSRVLPTVVAQKFPAVYHMNKGFSAWSAAGKPVEKK